MALDLQDGMLAYYLSQAEASDVNVEAKLAQYHAPVDLYAALDADPAAVVDWEALPPMRAANVICHIARKESTWGRHRAITLGDLLAVAGKTAAELARIPHCGQKTIEDIRECLDHYGLKLRDDG